MIKVLDIYQNIPIYGAVIAIINWLIKLLVQFTTVWYQFLDLTSEAKFQLTLLTFAQWINMTVPLLIVNFNFKDHLWVMNVQRTLHFEFAGERDVAGFVFHGNFKDLNRELIN